MSKILRLVIVTTLVLMLPLPLGLIAPANAVTYPRDEVVYAMIDGGRVETPHQANPYLPGWLGSAGENQLCIEYLFYYNYENGTLMPWLATGYEMSTDFKTLLIRLRPGVTWNDGAEFDANDVAFTYNMLLQPHTPPLGYESMVQDAIDSVEVVDRYTVRFNLKAPNPRIVRSDLFSVMIWGAVVIVPEHIWKDVDPTKFNNDPPVFTGPYKLIDRLETGDRFVWERRDDWWGTTVLGIRPAAKYYINVGFATEEALALSLAADNLDVAGYVTPGTHESLAARNPNIRAWYATKPYAWAEVCPLYLPVNTMRYPWNIREARIGLSYALDRDALNTIGQEGTAPSFPGIFSPYMEKRFMDALNAKADQYDALTYDPSKTAEIFTGLGWTKGADGIWVTDNGTRVTFEMLTHSAWLFIRKYGEQMVDQLRAVGIDASAKLLTGSAWDEAWIRGEWDGNAMWMCAGVDEPYYTLDWLHSKWVVPIGEIAPSNNVRWSNSAYDSIVDEMKSMSPDDPEYIGLFNQALDIYYQEMPVVATINQPALLDYNYKYWTNWPTAENAYIQPYYQCATFLFIMLNIKPAEIPTTVVYFTKDTPRFRGVDLVWYGPFKRGDATRLPTDDAEFWIRKDSASYSPPPSEVPPEIPVIARGVESLLEGVSGLASTIDAMSGSIDSLRQEMGALRGQISMFAAAAAVEGIAIIVLAAVLVLTRRKPSE